MLTKNPKEDWVFFAATLFTLMLVVGWKLLF